MRGSDQCRRHVHRPHGCGAQVEALATAGYRAISPDVRGFGESDTPVDLNAPVDSGACGPFHTAADVRGA